MMTYPRQWPVVLLLLSLSGAAFGQLHEIGDGSAGPVKAAHVTAELQSDSAAVQRGTSGTIALVMHLEPGWHVYWRNAGDSGEPPSVEWVLPQGVTLDKMQFAAPQRLPLGPLMDYGYVGTAVFPFTAHGGASLPAGTQTLKAHARWLVCREVCVPGRAFLGLSLPVSLSASAPSNPLIQAALDQEPSALPAADSVDVSATKDHLRLSIHTGKQEMSAEFYPYNEDALRNAAEQSLQTTPDGVQLTLERGDISSTLPTHLSGVLKLSGDRNYTFDAPVHALAATSHIGPTHPESHLAFILLLGLVGGLTLNLMPCVFPVLFLKALSLANSKSEDAYTQKMHGIAYTLGILVSFWAVVAALLAVRAGGHQVGWGFQLQSPGFVAVMASMLFFMALSLAGQFDIGLSLTGKGDALTRTHGYSGSFFTGVLATVVATPCTAPLMGAAIGYALSQSAVITFAVFTSIALGLALPYLLLTFQPGLSRWMPRPGRWMETLKQLTAVPLLLTVVWLVWVYGQLYSSSSAGADHIARLLLGLVLLSVAGWALGRWPAQRTGTIAAGAFVAASLAVSLVAPRPDPTEWKQFSTAAVQQARAEGRPVFVDFTAAWCLSCQVNERAVLHDPSVEHELNAKRYLLLRADWTRYDPEITRQLAAISRSGVPTYVIYPAQQNAPPEVLPELLTRSIVFDAIAKPRT